MISNQIISTFLFLFLVTISTALLAQNPGSWEQKENFNGISRFASSTFTIGDKGYMSSGNSPGQRLNDLWEYDSVNDTWTQLADLPGPIRELELVFQLEIEGLLV